MLLSTLEACQTSEGHFQVIVDIPKKLSEFSHGITK